MSAFSEDLNAGVDDQFAEAAETVTLARNGIEDETAAIPEQASRPVDVGESRVSGSERQFIFKATGYTIGGTETTPRIGDRITWNGLRFEVMPIVNGVDHFELYGAQGYAYRVYTSEIGPAT